MEQERKRPSGWVVTLCVLLGVLVVLALVTVGHSGAIASYRLERRTEGLLTGIQEGAITGKHLASMTLFEGDGDATWDPYLQKLRPALRSESWQVLGEVADGLGNQWVIVRMEADYGSGGWHLETVLYHDYSFFGLGLRNPDLVGGTLFEYLDNVDPDT